MPPRAISRASARCWRTRDTWRAAGGAGRLGARIAAPVTTPLDGWGYSAQWWHRGPDDGEDYSAMGIYGQYTYVHPGRRVVIVKLSDHGAEQDERGT